MHIEGFWGAFEPLPQELQASALRFKGIGLEDDSKLLQRKLGYLRQRLEEAAEPLM